MLQLSVCRFKTRSSDNPTHIHNIHSTGNESVLTVPRRMQWQTTPVQLNLPRKSSVGAPGV